MTNPPSAPSGRWLGTGRASGADAAHTAGRATEAAVAGRRPELLIVFSSPDYDPHAVIAGVRDAAGSDVPLVGCTTAGEIATGEAGAGSVVVAALGGPGLTVRTAVGDTSAGMREAGAAAAQAVTELERPNRMLLLLNDGLARDRSEMVRGAYGVAGARVVLAGGGAGDDLRMQHTLQFHGDDVLSGAVIGVGIDSDGPIGVGVGHGWRRVGAPMVVTESRGDAVVRLDDEPALDAYLSRLGAPPEVFEDPALFAPFALLHPLGLPERHGGEEVRAILGADYATRALLCGDVPQATMLWLMEGDAESVMHGTRVACDEALKPFDGRPPAGMLAFDCLARRTVLGDDGIEEEARFLADRVGAPVAGFYTYGEIARTRGSRGVHNATLVAVALG